MRKTILAYTVLLLECARTEGPPEALPDELEHMIKMNNDPYSDPADDIPKIEKFPELDGNFEGLLKSDPEQPPPEGRWSDKGSIIRVNQMQLAERKMNRLFPDFEAWHDHQLQLAPHELPIPTTPPPPERPPIEEHEDKSAHFMRGTFAVRGERELRMHTPSINWTTCDEFGADSENFNPGDIVNANWVPFYTWSDHFSLPHLIAHVHELRSATIPKVNHFYRRFNGILNRKVNWNHDNTIIMKFTNLETILFPVDRRGRYDFVSDNDNIEELRRDHNITVNVNTLHFKIVEPYVGLMYCHINYAHMMAREGFPPRTKKEKRELAKKLNFRGKGKTVRRSSQVELNEEYLEMKRQEEMIDRRIKTVDHLVNEPERKKRRRGRKKAFNLH